MKSIILIATATLAISFLMAMYVWQKKHLLKIRQQERVLKEVLEIYAVDFKRIAADGKLCKMFAHDLTAAQRIASHALETKYGSCVVYTTEEIVRAEGWLEWLLYKARRALRWSRFVYTPHRDYLDRRRDDRGCSAHPESTRPR
ncbi:hypothetical protein HX099_10670 [Thiopseudomonas alkaliphila]|uniref:Uncharacterized protein n=1 Tax=Thiopseudomonas alkaliphila TaxID=1697053 RepID=A0AAW7DTI4_9GAMM|nr:hypothetical protein [Thiopseudomonas alkaliphila]MDM1697116.1 hypothetical protein [Thiopseudomonas alkaliphila]